MKCTVLVPTLILLCGLGQAGEAPVTAPVTATSPVAAEIRAIESRIAVAGAKATVADLLALADAYEKAGQPLQAAGALERATRSGTASAANLRRLGRLNEASARWDQAVIAYKAAATADPKAADVATLQLRAARLMADTGDERAASTELQALATALVGTPAGSEALVEWQRRYLTRGDFGKERERSEDIATLQYAGEPRLSVLIGNGARRLAERGKPAEAGAALDALIKAAPAAAKQPEVLHAQAMVLAKTGKTAEAAAKMDELYGQTRQPDHLWFAAEMCREADKPRALALYLRVIQELPWHWTGFDAVGRARALGATRQQLEPLMPLLLASVGDDLNRQGRVLWMRGEISQDPAQLAKAVLVSVWDLDTDAVLAAAKANPAVRKAIETVAADPTAGGQCWQARCLIGFMDGKPEAIAAATREAGWWDEGRAGGWNDRIGRLLDERKADAATIERTFRPLVTGFLPANLRRNAAEHAGRRLNQAKAGEQAQALMQAAEAPSNDPLAALVAAEQKDPAKTLALALTPPAATPPLQQAWLRARAVNELRDDHPRQFELLQQTAQQGRNAWATVTWMDIAGQRNASGQYDAAIAAGLLIPADHVLRVQAAESLAWLQLKASRPAEAVASVRAAGGDKPSAWSSDQAEIVARAAVALGDAALYDQVVGEALARGDIDRQRQLISDFQPKEEWRQKLWRRLATESKARWLQADCLIALGESARVAAEYSDTRDQRERALCELANAARGRKDAPGEEKAVEQLLEQTLARGVSDYNRVSETLWRCLEARPKADPAVRTRWLEAVVRVGGSQQLWAYQLLSIQRLSSDPIEAAILVQRMVRTRGRNDGGGFDQVFTEVQKEAAQGRHGVAAAAFGHMAEWFNAVNEERRGSARRAAAEALAKIGGGAGATALIDDRDPKAPLLRAAALLAAGDEDEAYRQAIANPKLLEANIATLGSDLSLLIARNRIREGEFPAARDIIQRLIEARSGDRSAGETVAQAHLLLGDIEFRNANYPAALLEFQAITTGWPTTRAALDAGLRLGDTHLAARREADARKAYEVLVDHEDGETRIKARFRLAMLEHRAGNDTEASEHFREVSSMNPPKALADQLYLDWGKALIEKNQLAEAETLVTLVGLGDKRDPVAPGEPVRITLRDPWLQTSQNRTSVTVVVTTQSGDREEATLNLSSDAKGLFVGRIPTTLGSPKPGDRVVQVRGGDRITYDYTEEFRKGRRNLGEAGTVEVADNALLRAGSTPATTSLPGEASAEAQDTTQSLSEMLNELTPEAEAAQSIARARAKRVRGEQVRPGGSVYLAVRDTDRATSDKPDRITALIAAASGDEVQATLVETGPDTGIFRAVVASRIRPADVQVSDSAPGSNPLSLLAQPGTPEFDRADLAWIGAPDRKAGKTVTADLKRTMAVDGMTWSRGLIAKTSAPKPAAPEWKSGLSVEFFAGRDFAGTPAFKSISLPSALDFEVPSIGSENWCARWSGEIKVPEAGDYVLRTTADDGARVIIGGRTIIEDWGDGHAPTAFDGEIRLAAGWQPIVIDYFQGSGGGALTVAWAKKGSEPQPLRDSELRTRPGAGMDSQDRRISAYRIETSLDGLWWTPVFASVGKAQAIAGWAWSRRNEVKGKLAAPGKRVAAERMPNLDGNQGWKRTESLTFAAPADAAGAASVEVAGSLLIPKAGRYEFALRAGGSAYLQIGDEVLIDKPDVAADRAGNDLRWRGGMELPAGHARLLAGVLSESGDTSLTLLWKAPGAPDFVAVPREAFDPAITAEAIKRFTGRDAAAAKALADRAGATVAFPPIDARFVRMIIDAWEGGDAPALASLQVTAAGKTVLPAPGIDYRKLVADDVLELSPGDEVRVSYVDEANKSGQAQTLRARLKATFADGIVAFQEARTVTDREGNLAEELYDRYRFRVGDRITARIEDADLDTTDQPDRIAVRFSSAEGKIEVDAVETGPASGEFIAEIQTAVTGAPPAADKRPLLKVPKGDLVRVAYTDLENNRPGQPTERTASIRESVDGNRGVLIESSSWATANAKTQTQPAGVPAGLTLERGALSAQASVVPGAVMLQVIDPGALTSNASRVVVRLTTASGAVCDVALSPSSGADGVFMGSVLVQLGDASMPSYQLAPEGVQVSAKSLHPDAGRHGHPVVQAQGGEVVTVTYLAGVEPDADLAARTAAAGTADAAKATFRLATPARLDVVKDDFDNLASLVYVGGKLYVRLISPVADVTPDRDQVTVQLTSGPGDRLDLALEESEGHSGLFTGSIALEAGDKPNPADARFQVAFGDTVRVTLGGSTPPVTASVTVAKGADAQMQAFSRRFADELLAARTQVRLAECHFELYRGQRLNLKEMDQSGATASASELAEMKQLMANTLAEGVTLLRRTLADYPASAEQDRILYLLGQFEQESGQFDAAIDRYRTLISAYPGSTHAPEAQYKIAQCYEEQSRYDEAWEAYVRLGNRWPDHSLVADAMIRIGLYYQDRAKKVADEAEKIWRAGRNWIDPEEKRPEAGREDWIQAAGVYGRMVARFPDHPIADQTLLGQANALFQAQEWVKAKAVFDAFPRGYPTSVHLPKAMYWSGMCSLKVNDVKGCYLQFLRLLQDYPESTEAKLARGVLLEDGRFAELEVMKDLQKQE